MESMTLQEFITESLVSIVEGVKAAQHRTEEKGVGKGSGIAAAFTITEGETLPLDGGKKAVTTHAKGFATAQPRRSRVGRSTGAIKAQRGRARRNDCRNQRADRFGFRSRNRVVNHHRCGYSFAPLTGQNATGDG